MSKLPDHYSLVKEHDKHFEIHDKRDGKKFNVAKKGLHPAHQAEILRLKKMAEGGEVDSEDTGEDGVDEGMKTVPQNAEVLPDNGTPATTEEAPAQPPSSDWQASVGTMPAQPDTTPAIPTSATDIAGYPTSKELQGALTAQTQGKEAETSALQKQNDLLAQQQQKNIEADQKFMNDQQAKMAQYQAQYDNLSKEVAAGKIDPEAYLHNKSTGSKISAAIGLILGGIGSGMTGQPNAALQVLNKHIDNDIEAQKENLGNKRSLLSENLRMQGNMMTAMNMTRLQMNAMAEGKLKLIAAQTGNPIIQARAQQQIAQLQQQAIPLRAQVASNELSMQIKKDIMSKMASGQGGYDLQDLARANLVDKATAEKESTAISKRQQAEAEVDDAAKELWKEQEYFGGMKENYGLPNILNPQSSHRAAMLKSRVIQAIQSSAPSKKLNPDALALEIDPYVADLWRTDETKKEGLRGLINVIRSHADPTPTAVKWKVPGAIGGSNSLAKKYEPGPVK